MKEKIRIAMGKLKNTPMNIVNGYIYYNMYLIKQVYFGYGVISLMPKQEEILQEISEKVILRKLGLSERFPRDMLYSRKTALGVGIMKPSTIIDILALKLYVGHKRSNDRIAKIIRINEEEASYQNGFNENVIKTPRNLKLKERIWSDDIGEKLEKRMIEIVNNKNKIKIIT